MEKRVSINFIKFSEKMISPGEVATVYKGAEMLQKLPKTVQKYFVRKGSARKPDIGFVVEPYSFFLSYEIDDEQEAGKYIPKDYELMPCSLFLNGRQKKCAIIGCFNIHTSFFWGTRLELYLIAKNKRKNLLSWIICDYESNTINYDPGHGFLGSTTENSVYTTSFDGELIVDIKSKKTDNQLCLTAGLGRGKITDLNQRLWIEGNLSVDYSGEMTDKKNKPFGLIFDPNEMKKAVKIPISEIKIEKNTLGNKIISAEPCEACCFPYAQHFITTSFPKEHEMKTAADLENAVTEILDRET